MNNPHMDLLHIFEEGRYTVYPFTDPKNLEKLETDGFLRSGPYGGSYELTAKGLIERSKEIGKVHS